LYADAFHGHTFNRKTITIGLLKNNKTTLPEDYQHNKQGVGGNEGKKSRLDTPFGHVILTP
jgi:hypothetical protein